MSTQTIKASSVINFITNKRLAWLRHIIFLMLIAQTFNLFSPETMKFYAQKSGLPIRELYIVQGLQMIFSSLLIYINLYFLFPVFFKKGKYYYYFIGIILLAILFYLSIYGSQFLFTDQVKKLEFENIGLSFADFFETVLFPIVYILATTGYKIFKEWVADQERFAALEKEKLKAELSTLKSQVNPHFLFNTLNNLHVLIQVAPKKASDIVLGLSDVLRYQIYDSQQEKVALHKDIEIIEQYLELEKIRRDDLTFKVLKRGDLNNIFVPPLLFINFVDNAIKHSNSRESSIIDISFEKNERELHFEISNSKPTQMIKIKSNGFGLENVRKRLDLLYAINYSLKIVDEKDKYSVNLKFPI